MSKVESAAKEYCDKEIKHIVVDACGIIPWETEKTKIPHPVVEAAFINGAKWQAEQSKVLEEALEFCFRHGYICNHDDSSWCNDKCNAIHVAKDALKKYRESK